MKTESTKKIKNIASRIAEIDKVRPPSSYSFLSCKVSQPFDIKGKTTKFDCAASIELISCKNSNLLNSDSKNPENYRADNTVKTSLKLIIGIDPGISGAIAFISEGKFIAVYDLPTLKIKSKNGTKNRIDLEAFSLLIESYSKDVLTAFIEEVGQIGTKADPFSSFVFGFSTGLVHGVLGAFSIPINTIRPNVWKAFLGLDSDKDKSITKAIKLFPEASKHLSRKKDHGRAEALLIAHFAWKLSGAKK